MVEARPVLTLAQLATMFTGLNVSRVDTTEGAPAYPVVGTKDVGAKLTPRGGLDTMTLARPTVARRYGLVAGDVVVTARGVAVRAAVAEAQHQGAILGGNLIAVRPSGALDPHLLAVWLQHPRVQDRLLKTRAGVGTPGFTVGQLAQLAVALPGDSDQEDLSRLATLCARHAEAALRAADLRRRFVDDLVFESLDPSRARS